jgi:hypothetical protein
LYIAYIATFGSPTTKYVSAFTPAIDLALKSLHLTDAVQDELQLFALPHWYALFIVLALSSPQKLRQPLYVLGRKGPFCLYYMHIQPNDRSILAAGKWQPESTDLATIRHAFLTDPKPFRKVIGQKDFVKMFGEAKWKGRGVRSNVFGHDDE